MTINKFRTKARAIELLGRKQIRDDITALIELMKNSYDADAESVAVLFDNLGTDHSYIIMYDDGHGMLESDVVNKWLVLGTDSKKKDKKNKISNIKKRPLMGEKGIGRLASAALGEQLWMFTKHSTQNWHALYLNWNLFEIQDLYLEDVNIPLFFNRDPNEIIDNGFLKSMMSIQLDNLKNTIWYESNDVVKEQYKDIYFRIKSQIEKCLIPISQLSEIIHSIDEISQGTVLVIQDLRHSWEEVFDDSGNRSENYMATQKYNRLGSFVDSFNNTAKDFSIEIIANNQKAPFNHFIDDELHDLYDLKIKGEIIEGKFYGELFAPNGELELLKECNLDFRSGIDVTAGITNPAENYCGPIKLELCHYEKNPKNSGLTSEQIELLNSRIDYIGGLKVYRDNVRILPYGDPENDFLNLEQSRSKNAGRYLFSHRNLFGKIELTSEDNPFLEDKSSREGLIENNQYHYFVKVLQNLLFTVAVDYVTSSRKSSKGLRDTYLAYNNLQHQLKEEKNASLLKEETESKEEIKQLKVTFKEKQKQFNKIKNEGLAFHLPKLPSTLTYDLIQGAYAVFLSCKASFTEQLDNNKRLLTVEINPRIQPSMDEEDILEVMTHNQEVASFLITAELDFKNNCDKFQSEYKKLLVIWENQFYDALKLNFKTFIADNETRINQLNQKVQTLRDKTVNTITEVADSDTNRVQYSIKINNQIDQLKRQTLSMCEEKFKDISNILNSINLKIENLKKAEVHNIEISELKAHYTMIEEKIDLYESEELPAIREKYKLEINELFIEFAKTLLSEHQAKSYNETDKIIGILKEENAKLLRENEILTDLANIGMAAEIVNHEFNQLMTNVEDGISNIKSANLSSIQNYWVKQIEAGFRAISTKHSQLSPMYRSNHLSRRKINVRNLINDILNFFSSRLTQAHIKVENKIEEDYFLLLSTSKIYPVISNLIDNSIYWMLNKDTRVILFRSNSNKNTIYIEDSGPGISARDVDKIFNPFFTKRTGGRGLGLTIVKKVLESQKHQIKLIEDREDKHLDGACFEITFDEKARVNQ
ncbi:ATP-binding protein [Paenibacillus sp. SAF-054]|uniref:ATP-binding protein n=1 Tax=unclassified Paenibacillus TaxID=185978 RepID=UPI003F804A9E